MRLRWDNAWIVSISCRTMSNTVWNALGYSGRGGG